MPPESEKGPETQSVSGSRPELVPVRNQPDEWVPYNGNSNNPVFTYIEVQRRRISGPSHKLKYKCKLCKTIGALGRGPSNLKAHFNHKHRATDVTVPFGNRNNSSVIVTSSVRNGLQKMVTAKVPKNGNAQSKFVRLCAEWIALNGRPLSIVEDEGFRKIMNHVAPKFNDISRQSVSKVLRQSESNVDKKISEELSGLDILCATTDVWTSENNDSYSSLTLSYIDDDWVYHSKLFSCSKINGRHTGKELSKFLIEESRRGNFLKKVAFVTTDSASNAKKQVELTAEEEGLLSEIYQSSLNEKKIDSDSIASGETDNGDKAYIIAEEEQATASCHLSSERDGNSDSINGAPVPSLVVSDSDTDLDGNEFDSNLLVQISDDLPMMPQNFLDIQNVHSSQGSGRFRDSDMSVFRSSWCRIACASHSYQLSVRNCLNIPEVDSALKNVRMTMKFFKKSSVAGTYLIRELKAGKMKILRPLLDVRTRWGSTAVMIRRFLYLEPYLTTATDKLFADKVSWSGDGPGNRPTPRERMILEAVLEIVKSIDQSTSILGRQSGPTMHLKDICTAGILRKLQTLQSQPDNGSGVHEMASLLSGWILERRQKNNSECPIAEHCAHVATLLTPQFNQMKHREILGGDSAYSVSDLQALRIISAMSRTYTPDAVEESTNVISQDTSNEIEDEEDHILSYFQNRESQEQDSNVTSIEQEFSMYLATAKSANKMCPLQFWKQNCNSFPLLAQVARLVFTPSASSTTSERVFSVAGTIRSKKRSRLTAGMTECLLKVGDYLKKHKSLPESDEN